MVPSLPLLSCELSVSVKTLIENIYIYIYIIYICICIYIHIYIIYIWGPTGGVNLDILNILYIYIYIYIYWEYQDSPPAFSPSPPRWPPMLRSKFEILLFKIFSLKQKAKPNTSSYHRKNQIFTLQQNCLWFL